METMSQRFDNGKLLEGTLQIKFNRIEQHRRKEPGLQSKNIWSVYKQVYFFGVRYTSFNLIKCKERVVIL